MEKPHRMPDPLISSVVLGALAFYSLDAFLWGFVGFALLLALCIYLKETDQ